MNTRIKKLRNSLKLTQKQFGEQIGLKPTSICDIEQSRCSVTERCIIAICSRFNVNEEWLRYGTGEMFNTIEKSYNEFFDIFKKLNPVLQDFLIQTAKNLLDSQSKL